MGKQRMRLFRISILSRSIGRHAVDVEPLGIKPGSGHRIASQEYVEATIATCLILDFSSLFSFEQKTYAPPCSIPPSIFWECEK